MSLAIQKIQSKNPLPLFSKKAILNGSLEEVEKGKFWKFTSGMFVQYLNKREKDALLSSAALNLNSSKSISEEEKEEDLEEENFETGMAVSFESGNKAFKGIIESFSDDETSAKILLEDGKSKTVKLENLFILKEEE